MELQFRKISENEFDIVKEMLLQDKETSEDLWWAVGLEPDTLTVAYLDGTIVGLAQIEPGKNISSLVVFVSPEYRYKGIGENILNYAENILSEIQPKEILSNYLCNNENSKKFARKHGYERYFSSACMKYSDGKFDMEEIPVRQYRDDDYPQAHKLHSEAFHEMRVSVGDFPDSTVHQPSEEVRKACFEDAENRYTYIENEEIAGHGSLDGNEIDSVSIRTDLQGQGIGRKFVKFLCNEIYNKGHNEVILWCVVGNNKARNLYDSLGFKELYVSEYAHKYLAKNAG